MGGCPLGEHGDEHAPDIQRRIRRGIDAHAGAQHTLLAESAAMLVALSSSTARSAAVAMAASVSNGRQASTHSCADASEHDIRSLAVRNFSAPPGTTAKC
jgi:hypothetical protein